jgi:hypothetical protein
VCTNHQIAGKSEGDNDAACDRYRTASEELAKSESTASIADVMHIMDSVHQEHTMWSSVYNLTTGAFEVAYRKQYLEPFRDQLVEMTK